MWQKKLFASLAFAGCAAISASAQAGEQIVLQPASNWVLDYAEHSCALQRRFGDEARPAVLELRMFSPESHMQLMVAATASAQSSRRVRLTLLPDPPAEDRSFVLVMRFGSGLQGFVSLKSLNYLQPAQPSAQGGELPAPPQIETDRAAADQAAREAAITGLLVQEAFPDDLVFQTGELHAPMQAMRGCLEELMTHWGIDVAAHRSLRRSVRPTNFDSVAGEIRQHYPNGGRQGIGQALLAARVSVSENGRPTACFIANDFNDERFENMACRILLRDARFEPALDANGIAIASYYLLTVIYSAG